MRITPDLLKALERAPNPQPFTLKAFWRELQHARGDRPILVYDLDEEAQGSLSGLWIATTLRDHVLVAPAATGVFQEDIVLHEFSHMLLNHGRVSNANEALLRLLNPLITHLERTEGPIQALMARSKYDTPEEREAEKLASLLLLRAKSTPHADDRDGLRKLAQTFGYTIDGGLL